MTGRHHVIVGAGTAGFNAISTLAELEGKPLNVTLVSAELPYARMVLPYYLSSEIQRDNVFTISEERLASLGVELMLGRTAAGLDRTAKRLLLDDGTGVGYDDLLIATGSSATRPPLPGIDDARIFDHWTLANTDAIRPELQPDRHVVLIGGGFIAFTLVNPLLSTRVRLTVVEREAHILPRMLNAEAARIIEAWMRARGVEVITGAAVTHVEDAEGRKLVRLADGEVAPADLIIVATGIRPNIEWLKDSGLQVGQGLVVDEHLRTNDPAIYAAGDVAEVADVHTGRRSVTAIETAAMEQGRVIAANMAGQHRVYTGAMPMNVIEAVDLQAASFGDWMGPEASEGEAANGHYRRYIWDGQRLSGAVIIGPARQLAGENDIGMLKGLVQERVPLGPWKQLLLARPFEVKKAFLATRHVARLLPRTVLNTPSQPLETVLSGAPA
ncbi:MAG: FAD-dependent oxidoreductase [Chloroflexota bacterium]|nr:FAD-dependent oxidoreductase [Chloroflexota bacterium]